jgi:hypothetical protein
MTIKTNGPEAYEDRAVAEINAKRVAMNAISKKFKANALIKNLPSSTPFSANLNACPTEKSLVCMIVVLVIFRAYPKTK